MKILLIKPKWFVEGDAYKYKDLHRTPPLNLAIIAALSEGHEVKIIDEDVEEIVYSPDWDIVGITTVTFTSLSAYNISERFRDLGVKTVLGGIHPSLMPRECLKYADIVVTGEAEPVWKELLNDYDTGSLKQIYNGGYLRDLSEVPLPRRDLMPQKKYFANPVQITRGCPNSCEYCYLQSVPWGKYRKQKEIERVVEDIKRIKGKYLFIVDDNLFVNFDYAKKVLDAIAPLNKYFIIQAPSIIGRDEELLDKLQEAGCFAAAVGFQSVNQKTLDKAGIYQNRVDNYKELVHKLSKRNIMTDGFFMFGFDTDDKSVFENTLNMIKEVDLDDSILYLLTPYPGTELFKKMEKEGRINNYDWSKYSWYNCNFKPMQMSPEELKDGLSWIYTELNNHYKKTFPKRVWKYKKLFFKYLPLTVKVTSNYLNWVDVARLP